MEQIMIGREEGETVAIVELLDVVEDGGVGCSSSV